MDRPLAAAYVVFTASGQHAINLYLKLTRVARGTIVYSCVEKIDQLKFMTMVEHSLRAATVYVVKMLSYCMVFMKKHEATLTRWVEEP